MKIAIIDADLIGRKRHRFPNLACEKISGFYKDRGDDVVLKLDYECLSDFDKVFISKVFTDTPFPESVLNLSNVVYGGTGFYFDKAPNLPDEIEHCFPDYGLYDNWINDCIASGIPRSEFKEYLDYCVGFITRGCFRKCGFCVNQKYDRVFEHSPLSEFYYDDCKKICLLDDNFFGCPNWKSLLLQLIATGKPFKFKQGLDERLLTDEKCELLFSAKYDGQVTFAFDSIKDFDLIHEKLKMIRRFTDSVCTFYVLVGFESVDESDVLNMFRRIELLMNFHCTPYIMRYQNKNDAPWKSSKFYPVYVTVAAWCNQPSFFKKKSFFEFAAMRGATGQKAIDLLGWLDKKYMNMRW